MTHGNQLAIERQELFKKFASFEEELLLFLGLLGSFKISNDLKFECCIIFIHEISDHPEKWKGRTLIIIIHVALTI